MMTMIRSFLILTLIAALYACSPAGFGTKPTEKANTCPGEVIDPNGCITARCVGGISNPRVIVDWSKGTNPNSGVCHFAMDQRTTNALQKGDSFPEIADQFWWWVDIGEPATSPPYTVFSHTDTNVKAGETYSYRAKYRAETPSDTVEISLPLNQCTCGG